GRNLDWQVPSPNLKEKSNVIWAELPNGKTLSPTQIEHPETGSPSFEFTLPLAMKPGDTLNIIIKDNNAQKTVQRRRPFHLFIDPKGKGDYKESETFFLDVRGNHLTALKIIPPSPVARNKRFDVIVRFEDMY